MAWWDGLVQWFLRLGENYGVNPLIFGALSMVRTSRHKSNE